MRRFKPFVFLACLLPLARLGWKAYMGLLGANPIEVITHSTGDWTLIFLLITLAVRPLRKLSGQPWLIRYRRMFGLFAFFYVTLHFLTYIWLDKFFNVHDMLADIAKRKFITVDPLGPDFNQRLDSSAWRQALAGAASLDIRRGDLRGYPLSLAGES